jgi:hypothetical protein
MPQIKVYTVESGIPIPDENVRKNFMLSQMEVGDSILIPIEDRSSAASSASKIKARTGKEFTTRRVDTDHARVWRTK